jgi:hypothetical protein
MMLCGENGREIYSPEVDTVIDKEQANRLSERAHHPRASPAASPAASTTRIQTPKHPNIQTSKHPS